MQESLLLHCGERSLREGRKEPTDECHLTTEVATCDCVSLINWCEYCKVSL